MKKYLSFVFILSFSVYWSLAFTNNKLEKEVETVKVEKDIVVNNNILDSNTKYIALTFDDGPAKYTKEIGNILKENGAVATFFMLGCNLNIDYKDTLQELVRNGNEIGSHAYSHKMLTKVGKSKLDYEINYSKKLLGEMINTNVYLTRPPYGEINKYIKNNFDGPYIMWSLDTKDWKYRDAKRIYNYVLNNVSDGDIILMHETYLSSVEALRLFIPELQNNGYKFVTVSELAMLKNVSLDKNSCYRSFK